VDIVTQGLLGGVLGQSVANAEEKKHATVIGFFAGLVADADVFIASSADPLLHIEYHRHFTHSLFFIPFGAAIAMVLLRPFFRRQLATGRLYLFCLAGYSLSGMLDACTSYGTHLFWPLTDARVSFDIIAIVDPIFSLILLTAMLAGLRQTQVPFARIGLIACLGYLGLASIQHYRAGVLLENVMQQRGHQATRQTVKPTLGNILLWRTIYISDEVMYVDAVRVPLFGDNTVFNGRSVSVLNPARDLPTLPKDSILYRDILRFQHFSDGYMGFDPSQKHVIGDIRYSMVPDSVHPLWGIVIDPRHPKRHADYRFFRSNTRQNRQRFLNLLLNRPVAQ